MLFEEYLNTINVPYCDRKAPIMGLYVTGVLHIVLEQFSMTDGMSSHFFF